MAAVRSVSLEQPLTIEQQQAVRDVAAGRIQRYGVPGGWQVYSDEGQVVFEHAAGGWAARVAIERSDAPRPGDLA